MTESLGRKHLLADARDRATGGLHTAAGSLRHNPCGLADRKEGERLHTGWAANQLQMSPSCSTGQLSPAFKGFQAQDPLHLLASELTEQPVVLDLLLRQYAGHKTLAKHSINRNVVNWGGGKKDRGTGLVRKAHVLHMQVQVKAGTMEGLLSPARSDPWARGQEEA